MPVILRKPAVSKETEGTKKDVEYVLKHLDDFGNRESSFVWDPGTTREEKLRHRVWMVLYKRHEPSDLSVHELFEEKKRLAEQEIDDFEAIYPFEKTLRAVCATLIQEPLALD